MGLKKTLKRGIQQLLDGVHSLGRTTQQNALVETNHYESLMKQLNEIEQQSGSSISHITGQIDHLSGLIASRGGSESMSELSPAVNSLNRELSEHRAELEQHLESIREMIAGLPRDSSAQPDYSAQLQQLSTSVSKHNTVLMDLIESMEDAQEDQNDMLEEVKLVLSRDNESKLKDLRNEETALLQLIESYQDQLKVLEAAASSDPVWSHQFDLVRQKLATPLQTAGITLIDQKNIPVSYDLHEVIDRVDSTNPELQHCVAEIFKTGYIFKGQVLRKAQVSAFAMPAASASDVQG